MYRCEVASTHALIQLLACNYLPHGRVYYSDWVIGRGKDVRAVDEKMVSMYGLGGSRATRWRKRVRDGEPSVHYLRHGRKCLLVATGPEGSHLFFENEPYKDIRRQPFEYAGYSVTYGKGGDRREHALVWIERRRFETLRSRFVEQLALRCSCDELIGAFDGIPYVRYRPVRDQVLHILKHTNRRRRSAGLQLVDRASIDLKRRFVQGYQEAPSDDLSSST